jgi:hypothetical protein
LLIWDAVRHHNACPLAMVLTLTRYVTYNYVNVIWGLGGLGAIYINCMYNIYIYIYVYIYYIYNITLIS